MRITDEEFENALMNHVILDIMGKAEDKPSLNIKISLPLNDKMKNH